MVLKISQKGWVVFPAEFRKKYQLQPGTEVVFVDYGGVLSLVPAMKDAVNEAFGILAGEPSLTDELLKERKAP